MFTWLLLTFGLAYQVENACIEPTFAITKAADLIKENEGLAKCIGPKTDKCSIVKAYPNPGVGWELPTVCYGHTSLAADGRRLQVKRNDIFYKDDCDFLLYEDISSVAKQVCSVVNVPLKSEELASIVSFTYNLGFGTLKKSSLLRHINNKQFSLVPNDFLKYVYAGSPKRVFPGLLKRRSREADVFRNGRKN